MCGDGGFALSLGDMSDDHAVQPPHQTHGVQHNGALGMVKVEMEVAGLPDYQTDLKNPELCKTRPRAIGIAGSKNRKPGGCLVGNQKRRFSILVPR